MNEDAESSCGLHGERVTAAMEDQQRPVDGGDGASVGWFDGQPVPDHLLGKDRIGNLLDRHDTAGHGREDRDARHRCLSSVLISDPISSA